MTKHLIFLISLFPGILNAQQIFPLYTDSIPNSRAANNKEEKRPDALVDTISVFVSVPTLTYYPADSVSAGATAVIIFPGGGYHTLLTKREGSDVAKALNRNGISAFVVKYRLPDSAIMRDQSIGPLQDAQRAVCMVRENAKKWNIDPAKIGVMGFSAGGHLAATVTAHFSSSTIPNPNHTSLRPDFSLLINPVISMTTDLTHKGCFDKLLGSSPSADKIDFFSNEKHVGPSTPPCFLVHANDDSVVKVENSLAFYLALKKNSVPAELHIYNKGEHGFLTAPSFEEWFGRCLYWMRSYQAGLAR